MKKAIVTRADDNITEMSDITHPILKEYAEKVEADFLTISEDWDDCETDLGKKHFRIMHQREMFDDYDRILHIDSDILINPSAPDLFRIVPEWMTASIYEDKGSRMPDRMNRIQLVQRAWGHVGWYDGYINTGVFMASKRHAKLFEPVRNMYWEDLGYDDVHLGYQIKRNGVPHMELPFIFNHMSMFSEEWNGSPSRFDSMFIHYAGAGKFPGTNESDRTALIRKDAEILYPQRIVS